MTLRQTLGLFALCLLISMGVADGYSSASSLVTGCRGRVFVFSLWVWLACWSISQGGGGIRLRPWPVALSLGSSVFGLIGIPFLLLACGGGEGTFDIRSPGVCRNADPACSHRRILLTDNSTGLRPLPYGLLGVAGILILLPISLPQVSVGILWAGAICLAMVFTALSLFWLHRLLEPVSGSSGYRPLPGSSTGGLLLLAACSGVLESRIGTFAE